MTRYWLKVGESYRRLEAGHTIVGRSGAAHVRLSSSRVSRRHACFTHSEDALEVRDLGSRNGVLVNGEPIEDPRGLSGGDRVTIGPYTLEVWSGRSSRRHEHMATLEHHQHAQPRVDDASEPDAATGMQDPGEMMLWYVRDALSQRDTDSAADALRMLLERMHHRARRGRREDRAQVGAVSEALLETCERTADPRWLEALFRTNAEQDRVLGGAEVDRLYDLLPTLAEPPAEAYSRYVEHMRAGEGELPVEARAALRRVEGLRKLLFPDTG